MTLGEGWVNLGFLDLIVENNFEVKMKYDDAGWHNGADNFPGSSPPESGATHIALFLKWCFLKGWAGELHTHDWPKDLQQLLDGKVSATEFFFNCCDGKLTDEDFTDAGNAFAAQYYGDNGLYLDDYAKHFGELMYVRSEADHDYELFSKILNERFETGVLVKKPKWKFW